MELEGEGEANDACPGDADVGIRRVSHALSLVRLWRGYSLGVGVCRVVGSRRYGCARGAEGVKPKSEL
jgi:hypothetical protein